MSNANVVEVADVSKSFGDVVALQKINFSLKRGEILGVLGPNGAGKTTLLEIIEGLQQADVGIVSIFGSDIHQTSLTASRKQRASIGAMLQHHWLPPLSKVSEIVDVYALLYEGAMVGDELLQSMDLLGKKNARISGLSFGQKQRLAFGLAVIGRPKLLFLDEPTASLDPQGRRFVWDLVLRSRAETETATLLTTHSMEEAQLLCDRVLILDSGRIIDEGAPNDLIHKHCPGYRIRISCKQDEFQQLQQVWPGPAKWDESGIATLATSSLEAGLDSLQRVVGLNVETRIRNVEQNTLEDVFLKLTGRELRD
jgi:ABC-2 type transport system ATP-binding protein